MPPLQSQQPAYRRKQAMVRAAKDVPCRACGASYPFYVMEFDHRPGEKKVFQIGGNLSRSERALRAEMAKCDVVCANCHRARTWHRSKGLDDA